MKGSNILSKSHRVGNVIVMVAAFCTMFCVLLGISMSAPSAAYAEESEGGASLSVSQTDASQIDDMTAFATRLYSSCLGRTPDSEGLAHQVAALKAGTPPAEIAYNYFNSEEFQSFGLSNDEQVERVYQTMFGRASDPSGKAFWLQYLDCGMSIRSVIAGFSQAQEYKNYFASMGVDNQTIGTYEERDANQNVTAFVARLYTKVLERTYDVSGLNFWCGHILYDMGAGNVALGFFTSEEFTSRPLSNEEIVETAYATMLNRASDESGKQCWVDRMDAGMPISLLVGCFANSDEFRGLCASYGVDPGVVPVSLSDVQSYSTAKIMGASQTTVAQMVRRYEQVGQAYPSSVYSSKGASGIAEFCQILYEEANAEGVRAEVVFAQAMHETGWLQFGGDVQANQCNFAGLGATGGVPGNSFADVREGLRAQVQHLKAYASTDSLNNPCVDSRFRYVSRGCAPLVTDLGGKWAADSGYGTRLMDQVKILLAS